MLSGPQPESAKMYHAELSKQYVPGVTQGEQGKQTGTRVGHTRGADSMAVAAEMWGTAKWEDTTGEPHGQHRPHAHIRGRRNKQSLPLPSL